MTSSPKRRLPIWRELKYPNLAATDYSVKSDPTDEYNCAAFVVGITDDNLWPEPGLEEYSWPPGAKREESLDAFIVGYGHWGFQVCADATLEDGFEKIAIYAEYDVPHHVAVQLADGRWASKLGRGEDIHHPTLEALSSPNWYGEPSLFMRKRRA